MKRFYSGLVFDKDGTLFDFARTWEGWTETILIRLASDPDYIPIMGAAIGFNTATRTFAYDSVVIAGTPYEIAEALSDHVHDMSLPDIVMLLNREAARAPQVEAVPLVPLMDRFRAADFKLGVATNDSEDPARAHLESVGVADRFDFIAGFDSGFGGKPNPGQLLAFAQAMSLDPADCVMIGDSRHDLSAGRSAGFATVGVLTGYATANELSDLADVVLPNIGHLPDWLRMPPVGAS